jgi:hypothetical protein
MLTIKNVENIKLMLCNGESIERVKIHDDYYIFYYPKEGYEKYTDLDSLPIVLGRNLIAGSYYMWIYGARYQTETMVITKNLKSVSEFVNELKRILAKLV